MGYTNSPLTSYTRISPNRNSPRNHTIDRITPHCYVGQCGVESMAGWLCNPGAQASSNYGIGFDGKIGLFVSEQDRSWCSSSSANDNRAVTIECACDAFEPYAIKDSVYSSLIELMTDICKRNGKTKILWFGDKDKTLAYEPKPDEMVITVHRWFANKACPGDFIYNRLGQIANEINKRLGNEVEEPKWYRVRKTWKDEASQLGAYEKLQNAKDNCPPGYSVYDWNGNVVYANASTVSVISTASGLPKSKQDFIDKVSKIAVALYKENRILPSVVIAQCCLETGYGLGTDATVLVEHNNLLGMKVDLLNSTWKNYTVWNGVAFDKLTPEVYNGKTQYITDSFRVYTDYENCIQDYEMFLLHVKSGGEYKYRKVASMTDPQDVITAISKGGYATDPLYIAKVLKLIQENGFTKYDKEAGVEQQETIKPETKPSKYYRVQVGAFTEKDNANKRARQLKEKGFSTIIKSDNGMYKVQVGAFTKEANAEKKLKEVQAAGFPDAFVTR